MNLESLRIGCVKYLNARPLIHGWPGKVLFETPTALCQMLARGELDVALASSFEWLRNPIYKIVDLVSISSDGPVYSVILAHEPGSTSFSQIELDPASQTSVAMLKCLLADRGDKFSAAEMPADKLSPLQSGRARLLIGDQAIFFRKKFGERFSYVDLGAEWKKNVDLPFVYALWLMRPEVPAAKKIAGQLRRLRDENLGKIDSLVPADFDRAFCARYFRENVRFDFGDREKQGLRIFGELCRKHGLLPENPKTLALI